MQKYFKAFALSLQDTNADGIPEQCAVSFDVGDRDDKSYHSSGRTKVKINPFDTVIAATRQAIEQIAAQEGITLQ